MNCAYLYVIGGAEILEAWDLTSIYQTHPKLVALHVQAMCSSMMEPLSISHLMPSYALSKMVIRANLCASHSIDSKALLGWTKYVLIFGLQVTKHLFFLFWI